MTANSTHTVEIHDTVVTKRYRSWERDEPGREWHALNLLATHAPNLAPTPLTAELHANPPQITMSYLPGASLAANPPASAEQVKALAQAITTLHEAVPPARLTDTPPRIWHPYQALDHARRLAHARPVLGNDPTTARAYAAASKWVSDPTIDHAASTTPRLILGQADGNIANYLWDETNAHVRIVDFENSGISDATFEIAEITEHPTTWTNGTIDTAALLDHLPLTKPETARLLQLRRLLAFWWLLMLLPSGPYHARNPRGTLNRQAQRLLTLLDTH